MRLFILGNGPSLNGQRHLMAEVGKYPTFCCTRMVQWDGLTFVPTYYACNLDLVKLGIEPESPPNTGGKFLISFTAEALPGWKPFRKAPDAPLALSGEPLRSGGTMPYIAAQIAVRLGYTELLFLGIEQKGRGHCFDPGGTVHPFIPASREKSQGRWQEMKDLYEASGIDLVDCTPGGALNDILGYQTLEEALDGVLVG